MKPICDIVVALQSSFSCPGISSKRYICFWEDEMEINYNEKWVEKWLHRRKLNQYCYVWQVSSTLGIIWLTLDLENHKELENRTVPIRQSCKPSQHPSLIWEKCWFRVIWSRFRCYHGVLMMLALQSGPVGCSAAPCKGPGFALTELLVVNHLILSAAD